jgi:hypothetical protein
MQADITCPLQTITGFTAVIERRQHYQHSRRPAQKARFGTDYDEVQRSEYLTSWNRVLLGSL